MQLTKAEVNEPPGHEIESGPGVGSAHRPDSICATDVRKKESVPVLELEGRSIYYETFGDPADPTLLLVSGLTSQLTAWPEGFCEAFVDRGFHVVRFDNRDCGLSTIFPVGATYTLSEMADDAAQLLTHVSEGPAHVLGISMGGMIVQTLAAERPELVATMTSYASSTGNPDVGHPTPEAWKLLMAPAPTNRAEAVAAGVAGKEMWGTKDTWSEEEFGEFCGDNWDRSHPDGGGERQFAAISAAGDRSAQVATISCPSLVIHGDADTLINVSGGQHTAELIPDCEYIEVEGMGHDIPITEWPMIVSVVTNLVVRAAAGAR
jgi:pimeloyl-ACP methyl ester carboxylesterase